MISLLAVHGGDASSKPSLSDVSANEILVKIQNGEPVEYDHVIIKGDLSLNQLVSSAKYIGQTPPVILRRPGNVTVIKMPNLPENMSIVSIPIQITDSVIDGDVNFNDTIFKRAVNFRGSKFNGNTYFIRSQFDGSTYFDKAWFMEEVYFIGSRFNSDAYFLGARFKRSSYFFWSKFNYTTSFKDSQFSEECLFSVSQFNRGADFFESNFNEYTDFTRTQFNEGAYFADAKFNGIVEFEESQFIGANFQRCQFNSTSNFMGFQSREESTFRDAKFISTASFEGSNFNGFSDFSNSVFNEEASFNDARFNGRTYFECSRFKDDALFEGADFNCTLYLTRTKYDKLYIRWHNINDLAYDDAAYLSLMENFKKLGYLVDYDNCYFEYRKEHRGQNWSGNYHGMPPIEEWIRKRIDVVLELTYGYGKKPLYPLVWSIGTILLFGAFWGIIGQRRREIAMDEYSSMWNKVEKESYFKNRMWDKIRLILKPFIFSTTLFLSGTKLFVDIPETPEIPGLSQSLIKCIFTMERILGAFFSILLFLAIGGTIVR
jgi:uncharacterized protein YjbI with pentapeptide repeats